MAPEHSFHTNETEVNSNFIEKMFPPLIYIGTPTKVKENLTKKINMRNEPLYELFCDTHLVTGRGSRSLEWRPTDGSLGPVTGAVPSALLERNYLRLYGFMVDLLFYTDEYFV